jgi:hypothetical protein
VNDAPAHDLNEVPRKRGFANARSLMGKAADGNTYNDKSPPRCAYFCLPALFEALYIFCAFNAGLAL